MELRQLRYFVAVAEDLHFARAAGRLHMAQQSLSFQIKQLEDELGVRLFQRTTRHVELTEAGHALLKEVRLALGHLERGLEAVQRAGRGEMGRLVVGYNSTISYNVLPWIMRVFREECPDVAIVLRELPSPILEERLMAGDLDVGLLLVPASSFPDLGQKKIYREQTVVALPYDHPLAHRTSVSLSELGKDSFIGCPRELKPVVYDQLQAACQEAGFTPRIVQEAGSENALISLVAAGVGIALVAQGVSSLRRDDVVYPVVEPKIEFDISVAWHKQTATPLIKRFVQMARTLYPEHVLAIAETCDCECFAF
jgi:DNA-binding transcriptional LysR family regulator